ncbi:MAG: carboxypeptidase regulatory-like domain-containing protein [Myxococcaceae bacterium]|nr:carboxypeptidase regulatory-like domain-containing protein [Myxococcaceae bacterium]MCA3011808.1 carboxypeptidase regulatory-like domain-containing protein [Myxococcaceae bacterium]
MVLRLPLVLVALSSCGFEPLSREELFGLRVAPKVRLTGTVTGAGGGPIEGVTVTLASAATATDARGVFVLDDLAPGPFGGAALKAGYEREDFSVTLVEGTNRKDLVLRTATCATCARLTGLVLDADTGAALAGATVAAGGMLATTSASGSYALEGLMAGPLSGRVTKAGYVSLPLERTLRAGDNRFDAALLSLPCGGCAGGEVCEPVQRQCVAAATLTTTVVDDCTGAAVTAKVRVQDRATCSAGPRGYFELRGLVPGGPQTMAVGKTGYQSVNRQVTLRSGFNAEPVVRLVPVSGCSPPTPDVACTCAEPECQAP